jgi:CBS domain-containing protein
MHAIDIGTSRVIVADPHQTVHSAARLMDKHMVGCVVAVACESLNSMPIGMLTDRDICRLLAHDSRAGERSVLSTMSRPLVTCSRNASLVEVVQTMHGSGLRRLPLIDEAGGLVGIVTADDAVTAVNHLLSLLGEVLVVEPELTNRLVDLQRAADRLDNSRI